jgi:hypothetical protein
MPLARKVSRWNSCERDQSAPRSNWLSAPMPKPVVSSLRRSVRV